MEWEYKLSNFLWIWENLVINGAIDCASEYNFF
jgi:hypothetical protein